MGKFSKIKPQDVVVAMSRIRAGEWLDGRGNRKIYCVADREGHHFPPKMVVDSAYKAVTGKCIEDDWHSFIAREARTCLKALDFNAFRVTRNIM